MIIMMMMIMIIIIIIIITDSMVPMKITVLRDTTSYSLVDSCQRFG